VRCHLLKEASIENHYDSPLGKGVKRVDVYEKVTGKAQYVEDIKYKFSNLLTVKVLRSPHTHAEILDIDISKAEKLDGVKCIITGKDCPRTYHRSEVFSFPALEKVTWAGQSVAAIAATTEEIALKALSLIKVSYKELPFVTDVEEAMRPDTKSVVDPYMGTYPDGRQFVPEAPNISSHEKVRVGDIAKGFEEADVVVENRYYASRISNAQMERASCIVEPDYDGKGITMWTNGCGVHNPIKTLICPLFNLEYSRVRVIQQYQGGSFGNRLIPYVEPLATLMALKTRQPVMFMFSRQEMFISGPSNWPVLVKIKTGATKDGILVAQQMDVIEDDGAHQNNSRDGRSTGSAAIAVYRCPNFYQDVYAVVTNTPPVGPLRGLGAPQMTFAVESQMNEIADILNISPLEIRTRNILNKGEKNAYSETIRSIGAKKCIQAVAEKIRINEHPTQEDGPWKKGKGIAVGGKQNTPLGRSEAEVLVHSDGMIEVLISCDENGMGAETVMSQIAAHEFGVSMDMVKITRSDTGRTPYDNFSASSRTTYTTGNALVLACQDAKRQLRIAASEIAGVVPDKVEIKNNKAVIIGGVIDYIPIPELFKPFNMFEQQSRGLMVGTPIRGHGTYAPAPAVKWNPEDGQTPRMWNWYQYNAFGVEVAVNVETGQVKILKYATASDMGFPINPMSCEAQQQGGVCMAASFCINEEYLYNEQGNIINGSFLDYRISTILDVPTKDNSHCIFCPDPLPDGPYGAKGVAEGVTVPVGPAIAEAIYNAVGVRPRVMPMSAERILALIKQKEEFE